MNVLTLVIVTSVLVLTLSLVILTITSRNGKRLAPSKESANENYIIPSEVDLNTLIWSNGYNLIDIEKGNVLIGNSDEHSSDPTNYNSRYACDSTFPDDYESDIVNGFYSKYPGKIYVFNLNRKSLNKSQSIRTHALPVGIDFHTLTNRPLWGEPLTSWSAQMSKLVKMRNEAKSIRNRKKRVLITWIDPNLEDYNRFKPEHMERKEIKTMLLKTGLCDYVLGTRTELWEKMCEYAFVYSPNGRGFDCHRTWEALALGCLVIAQDNPAISEFADMFPIATHKPGIDNFNSEYLDKLLTKYKPADLDDLTMQRVFSSK